MIAKSLNHLMDARIMLAMLPRGMRDLDGRDSAGVERIRQEFLRVSGLYGFEFVDPSPLESLPVLETRSGPAIRDEIYHFEDKGGREVALRFDFTMGLARRASAQRSERLPSRVSSFGGVFRYDEPQKGRYRYFHQWDMEVFGKPTVYADAEIIEATALLFESLDMPDVSIRVSHRGLVESKIRRVLGGGSGDANNSHISDAQVSDALRAVDKAPKKKRDEILSEYAKGGEATRDTELLAQILDFTKVSGSLSDVESAADGVAGLEGWDHLASMIDSLDSRKVRNVQVDLGIVRGLDYYSGMVFEVFDHASGGMDAEDGNSSGGMALAGGGRYDALTSAFGRDDLGAAGAAGGVERTLLAMRGRGLLDGDDDNYANGHTKMIPVLHAAPEARGDAEQIASMLRRSGIAAESDIAGRNNLKKQLGHASLNRRVHAVLIVGPREIAAGTVTLRMMNDDGEARQSTLLLEDLRRDPHGALCL